jgi:ParB family transcriptional regulator, chromosome partitioning protein
MQKTNKKPLGQGLSALIKADTDSISNSAYRENFDIKNILPNPYQPRMKIDPEELVEIADSIREKGVIQPLIVTKSDEDDKYYLIAGERRWKAAQLAGLKRVPVVIKDSSPQDMLELALIENIQREDLNALEEALAFKQLQEEFLLTHDEIAKKVGLSRVAVTNKIRLLNLPEQVKENILSNELSEGHARALLGLKDKDSITSAANIVLKRGLSVRDTEQLVRRITYARDENIQTTQKITKEITNWEDRISRKLGFKSKIKKLNKGGKLIIAFNSDPELRDLVERLSR